MKYNLFTFYLALYKFVVYAPYGIENIYVYVYHMLFMSFAFMHLKHSIYICNSFV